MFCKRCGKFNPDGEPVCKYCGGELTRDDNYKRSDSSYGADQTIVGVLLAIFLGVIGLVIGLLVYKGGYDRNTFLSGWIKGFVGYVVVVVMLIGFVCCLPLLY